MEQIIIVLGTKSYKFQNKETKEIISGNAVHYLVNKAQEDNGYIPCKANMPFEFAIQAPCKAKAKFIAVNASGKLTFKLDSIDYIEPIDFEEVFA